MTTQKPLTVLQSFIQIKQNTCQLFSQLVPLIVCKGLYVQVETALDHKLAYLIINFFKCDTRYIRTESGSYVANDFISFIEWTEYLKYRDNSYWIIIYPTPLFTKRNILVTGPTDLLVVDKPAALCYVFNFHPLKKTLLSCT